MEEEEEEEENPAGSHQLHVLTNFNQTKQAKETTQRFPLNSSPWLENRHCSCNDVRNNLLMFSEPSCTDYKVAILVCFHLFSPFSALVICAEPVSYLTFNCFFTFLGSFAKEHSHLKSFLQNHLFIALVFMVKNSSCIYILSLRLWKHNKKEDQQGEKDGNAAFKQLSRTLISCFRARPNKPAWMYVSIMTLLSIFQGCLLLTVVRRQQFRCYG